MKPDLRKLFLPSIFLCFLAEIHLVVAGKVSFVTKLPVSFPSSSQFSNPLKNWWDIPLNGELEPTFFLQLHNISFDTVKNYSYPIIIVDPQEAQFDQEQVSANLSEHHLREQHLAAYPCFSVLNGILHFEGITSGLFARFRLHMFLVHHSLPVWCTQ